MVLEVGRICVKTTGRDAMQYGVIVEKIDDNYVLLDGQVRRRKVNIQHIEPLMKTVDIKKGADTKTVVKALNDAGFEFQARKEKKDVNTTPRPKKTKVVKNTDKKAKKE